MRVSLPGLSFWAGASVFSVRGGRVDAVVRARERLRREVLLGGKRGRVNSAF